MRDSTQLPAEGVVSAEQWAAFGVHEITLPTGARVEIRLPDMGLLLAANRVPARLRDGALKRFREAIEEPDPETDPEAAALAAAEESTDEKKAKDDPFDPEKLAELRDLNFWLVEQMLVRPKVTVAQMLEGAIPNEDMELLVDVALRETDEDALGVKIGVRRLAEFDRFPDEPERDPLGTSLRQDAETLPDPRLG